MNLSRQFFEAIDDKWRYVVHTCVRSVPVTLHIDVGIQPLSIVLLRRSLSLLEHRMNHLHIFLRGTTLNHK